jgi:hypothetical protein
MRNNNLKIWYFEIQQKWTTKNFNVSYVKPCFLQLVIACQDFSQKTDTPTAQRAWEIWFKIRKEKNAFSVPRMMSKCTLNWIIFIEPLSNAKTELKIIQKISLYWEWQRSIKSNRLLLKRINRLMSKRMTLVDQLNQKHQWLNILQWSLATQVQPVDL